MNIVVQENEPSIKVQGFRHLDQTIDTATQLARNKGILSIIFLNADNADSLSMVVGGDETVLGFTYGHQDPPYYASKGKQDTDEPVMICFLLFQHHTEFSRKHVIPFAEGLMAVHEFYESNKLPSCVEWIEV